MKKREFSISGYVKTQVGETSFWVTVKSAKSIGATAEQFEADNPDARITTIAVR